MALRCLYNALGHGKLFGVQSMPWDRPKKFLRQFGYKRSENNSSCAGDILYFGKHWLVYSRVPYFQASWEWLIQIKADPLQHKFFQTSVSNMVVKKLIRTTLRRTFSNMTKKVKNFNTFSSHNDAFKLKVKFSRRTDHNRKRWNKSEGRFNKRNSKSHKNDKIR